MVGITAHDMGHITMRVVGTKTQVARRMGRLRKLLKTWLIPEPVAASLGGLTRARLDHHRGGKLHLRFGPCTDSAGCAGASDRLRAGMVTYHNAVKAGELGVPERMLEKHGAVSRQVAEAMAVGMRDRADADIAVSTTVPSGPVGDEGGQRSAWSGSLPIATASSATACTSPATANVQARNPLARVDTSPGACCIRSASPGSATRPSRASELVDRRATGQGRRPRLPPSASMPTRPGARRPDAKASSGRPGYRRGGRRGTARTERGGGRRHGLERNARNNPYSAPGGGRERAGSWPRPWPWKGA